MLSPSARQSMLSIPFRVKKTTHIGFRVGSETGNYKYFFPLCRGFLKIRVRKKIYEAKVDGNVEFRN